MAYGNLLMSPFRLPSRECAVVATCEFWRARRIEHDLALLCVQGDPGG